MKEARFYEKLEGGAVRCGLCPHECVIRQGRRGICGVRENRSGTLVSLVFGKPVASHIDPIEKKPLFHFLPGTRSFSLATAGCNMNCLFCQNADISQGPREKGVIEGEDADPESVVQAAAGRSCKTISYTYTEPAVYWEYAYDIAGLAGSAGIRNVFVTNGFWSKEALEAMLPFMHAANVDLKFFRDSSYKKICGARLQPVLDTIAAMHRGGVWVEVTTLLVPGLNDTEEEIGEIARFIAGVDPSIPWHISRFHPQYRMMDRPPTDPRRISRARDIGVKSGLRFVYSGNVPGDEGENTNCPSCGNSLILRYGFTVQKNAVRDGKCPRCGETIQGVWE
ncbi:AmmeMemoRadiSam system radical SAM enzyme [bacterium]|nr:AmmeMemoRadiSam system radical SAM enzyme [bacterium]